MGTTDTCLFTGELLSPDTREEHTIPRSLAGRIRSRRVSSDWFNKAAGDGVDKNLAAVYAPLFNRLGPLTPSEHRAPSLEAAMYGSEKVFVLDEGMVLRQKHVEVEKRDRVTGKPSVFTAPSLEAARKFAKASKIDITSSRFTPVRPADGSRGWLDFSGFDPAAEVGALKSALLTFDHLLADDQRRRFTRDAALSTVREFVRRAVVEKRWEGLGNFVLGLQYDSLLDLKRLREGVESKLSPFEHVTIATTNSATRCLDILFWIASVDPFAFRLTRNWNGGAFTAVVVSGTLKGTGTVGPTWLHEQIHFRPKPHLSSVRVGVSAKEATRDAKRAAGEMSVFRIRAIREAANLVEHECDEFVRDGLAWDAQNLAAHTGSGLICDAVRRRLETMYALPIADPRKRDQLESAVERRFSELGPALLRESVQKDGGTVGGASWACWLGVYRLLLKDATELFGLPGEIEPSGTDVELHRASSTS